MTSSIMEFCDPLQTLTPSVAKFDGLKLINRLYILPLQCGIGITGCALVFIVLSCKTRRNLRSKYSLAAMALSDLLFMLIWVPQILVVHDLFVYMPGFVNWFVRFYPAQMMLLNSFYAISIW